MINLEENLKYVSHDTPGSTDSKNTQIQASMLQRIMQ